ncbi:9073_t:CDS:2 [Acaulospora colombiana]|uniref:9073_t:CDS:1 n=1 Tax=Acaulospora colombiana TaxID=27376 RepID=A0ACA9KDN2_9GLOM|nr:9073_t:CDS:2 [Acaulospora colombiana]
MNETGDASVDKSNDDDDPTSSQQTKDKHPQQPAPTLRKKPGRKPNPASPALRKAQNRAAQRAFRERKERHLKELENTIQSLRAMQTETTNNFHREREQLRSLIERIKTENYYLKYIAFNFECALNSINGNNEATSKIKNSIFSNIISPSSYCDIGNFDQLSVIPTGATSIGLSGSQPPTLQQVPTLNLNNVGTSVVPFTLQSPTSNSITLSPKSANISSPASAINSPPTPNSTIQLSNNPFYQKLSDQLIKSLIQNSVSSRLVPKQTSTDDSSGDTFISVSPPLVQDHSNFLESNSNEFNTTFALSGDVEQINDNLKNSYSANSNFIVIPGIMEQHVTKEVDQLIRLAKIVGCTDLSVPVKPLVRRPLTEKQESYLSFQHDPRIDLIPCLHLRSRMIQYQGHYDLYELCELLINETKCYGDPLDPDSWELPDRFFEKFKFLAFQHCRLKSSFYQRYGRLPADFNNVYEQYAKEGACI